MEKEKLYFDKDAYMHIMKFWPNVSKVIADVINFSNDEKSFSEENIEIEGIRNKTYSYKYNSEHQMKIDNEEVTGREFVFESSDGRKITIEKCDKTIWSNPFDFKDMSYVRLSYKLGEKNLDFNMSYNRRENEDEDKFRNISTIVKYDEIEFKNSLFKKYRKLASDGKYEEARKCMQVHKEIIEKLIGSVFNKEELSFIHNKLVEINRQTLDERRKNRLLDKERIFIALASYNRGISR